MLNVDYEMRSSQIQLQSERRIADLERQHALEIGKLQQKNEQANLLLVGLSQYLQENKLLGKASIPTKAGPSHQPTSKQIKTYSQHEVIQEVPPRTSHKKNR